MIEGVRKLGRDRYQVRVERKNARTGETTNRKAIVHGTQADAVKRRDELRDELAATVEKPQRLQLRAYVERWLERRRAQAELGQLKPATIRKYEFACRHIVYALGAYFVDALVSGDVTAYVTSRLAAAAGNTVLNELRTLRTIARDSVTDGQATRYWCDRVKAPPVAKYGDDNPNLLTPAQAERVLELVPRHWQGMLMLLVTTGLRFGECSALRWCDIEPDAGVARIRRSNDRGVVVEPKNESSKRTVAVLAEVYALLVDGHRDLKPENLVFATRRGRGGLHRGSPLRSVLAKACAAAGVPRVTTHGLRRTFNNEGRKVADREVLQATTGHATDAMTSHYSHVSAAEKHELARAVASRLGVLRLASPSLGPSSPPDTTRRKSR